MGTRQGGPQTRFRGGRVRLAAVTAAFAVALALAVPAAAAADSFSSTLRAAEAMLSGAAHGAGVRHQRPARDLTPLLIQLAGRLNTVTPEKRQRAARLLARPTDGGADPQQNGYTAPEAHGSPYCTAHFCIHWVSSGPDAPSLADSNGNGVPDYAEQVAAVAENVYSVENGQLGWRPPKGDGRHGGGLNLTDIYLKNLGGTGIYGYTSPDPGQLSAPGSGHSLYAYLVMDNSFDASKFPQYSSPLTPLEVTLAHEYNHVLQFNYDALEDTWMLESTAVWMEGRVYAAVHDYFQYLPAWTQLTRVPITTFDTLSSSNPVNVKVYGSSVWNKWLDARYGPTVVRGAWEASMHVRPASFAIASYDASIRAHGGRGFFDEFSRFAAATAEWQQPGSGFPDGPAYPDVQRVGALATDARSASLRLDHTAFADLDARASGTQPVKLIVSAPRGTASAFALVGRGSGGVASALYELPHGGTAAVSLSDPAAYSRLTAVVVNADGSERGYSQSRADWAYRKNGQSYSVRLSSDFVAPLVRSIAGSRGAVRITFSKPVTGLSPASVVLFGPGGRRLRVRVRLTRGARTAVVTPAGRLRRSARYRLKLLGGITDTDLNPLPSASYRVAAGG